MTGFPWSQGDLLLANDLNAAIAAASSAVAAGALPGIVVPAGGSIQAAHDALPATGGAITLLANTTYVLTTTLNITKPNVAIQAPSWNTVIRRGTGLGNVHTISATSAAIGFTIRGVTVDGGGITNTGGTFEIATNGPDSLVQRCQVIDFAGQGAIALSATGARADGNRIIGPSQNNHVGSYGVWSVAHFKTVITNNHITGTSIDGIGFDGPGTQVIGNYVAGCQCWAATTAGNMGGGQICQYSPGQYPGALIEGNFIDQGGGNLSYGIELNGCHLTVVGNTIINQQNAGMFVDGGTGDGVLIIGNTVMNCGQGSYGVGFALYPPLNNVVITGNRFVDTQATKTQQWGVWFSPGTCNNVVVVGNDFTGNAGGQNYTPPSAGTGHVSRDNLGASDQPGTPAINAASDAAAATAGVAVGGTYRNGSVIMVRVA